MKNPLVIAVLAACAAAADGTPIFAFEWRHGGVGHSEPADDETDDLELEITGPIEAIDTPTRTITILGVNIVVAAPVAGNPNRKGGNPIDVFPTLEAGQFVKTRIVSAGAPLTAQAISLVSVYEQALKLQGVLQSIDMDAGTITVLGLTISASAAVFNGAEDRGSDVAALTLESLSAGQNIEVQLDSASLPAFVATRIKVQNFMNQMDLEFYDKNVRIDHFDEDVEVNIIEVVKVRNSAGKLQKTEFRMHATTRAGTVSFRGLVPGTAKVEVTRAGVTTKKAIKVESNLKRTQRVKLKS